MSEGKSNYKRRKIEDPYQVWKAEFLQDADRMGLTKEQQNDENWLRKQYQEFLADDGGILSNSEEENEDDGRLKVNTDDPEDKYEKKRIYTYAVKKRQGELQRRGRAVNPGFYEKCVGCGDMTGRSAKNKLEPKGESFPLCGFCYAENPEFFLRDWTRGGFFFNKKKTRKRKKKTKGKKKKKIKSRKKKKKTRKHPKEPNDRKFTDTNYPYRIIGKKKAIKEFLSLREMVKKKDFNSKSVLGNRVVDYGTEKMRKKTKYRNKSHFERWNDKVARDKVIKFARRLYKKGDKRTIEASIRGAIELQWGSVNTMRPAAAACAYKKNKATKVLDFTAGWGARLVAAMAMDIDYIGIDANTSLKPGYDKIIKLLKPYSKSKVKMIFKKAETVDFSKLKYDFVFTSPPYEYLEVYENMENYENKGQKVSQPYSSSKIKLDDSEKFYDEFMIPTLKRIYKHLPKGRHICLNMPDIMYTKIKKKWKKADKKDIYSIVGRVGGPEDFKRLEKEQIFCWKKH